MTSVADSIGKIASYSDSVADKKKSDKELGMTDFLTMLVAQLQHQDPLNPMESQDFTAQLTQFSQLEAQFDANETLKNIDKNISSQTGRSADSYLDKNVTASVDTIDVTGGDVTGGFYTIEEPAEITIFIYDDEGNEVARVPSGQKDAGSYPVKWSGKDNNGDLVEDGTYKYSVQALTSKGYIPVTTTITGQVSSVIYQGDKEYLVVNGVLVTPESVLETKTKESSEFDPSNSFDYLGKTVTAFQGMIYAKNGKIESKLPSFTPEEDGATRVNILNALGQVVYSYYDGDLKEGEEKQVEWDGKDQAGDTVPSGYYFYVLTGKSKIDTTVKGEVTGVYYENNRHYLDIDGVRVAPEDIKFLEKD